MNQPTLDARQFRHDLIGLVEPLETVKMLLDVGKIEQAVKIQTAAIETLKKLAKRVDEASAGKRGDES